MRLVSAAPLGLAGLVGAEVGLGLMAAQAAGAPTLPALLIGIGLSLPVIVVGWFVRDHFALRREVATDKDVRKVVLEEAKSLIKTRHAENQKTAAEYAGAVNGRLDRLEEKLDPVLFMMMGVGGKGGYLEEVTRNRDRRHAFANYLHTIQSDFFHLSEWAELVGKQLGIPYRSPTLPLHRRTGDSADR